MRPVEEHHIGPQALFQPDNKGPKKSAAKSKRSFLMRRLAGAVIVCIACLVAWTGEARAQRGLDWMTSNGDAQRSAWVRADAKISKESLQDPKRKLGFQLLWKLKLDNKPRQLNSLAPPATLERLIGYRGFRMLGFVGGSADAVFTIDTDLGRMEWEKRLASTAPSPA